MGFGRGFRRRITGALLTAVLLVLPLSGPLCALVCDASPANHHEHATHHDHGDDATRLSLAAQPDLPCPIERVIEVAVAMGPDRAASELSLAVAPAAQLNPDPLEPESRTASSVRGAPPGAIPSTARPVVLRI